MRLQDLAGGREQFGCEVEGLGSGGQNSWSSRMNRPASNLVDAEGERASQRVNHGFNSRRITSGTWATATSETRGRQSANSSSQKCLAGPWIPGDDLPTRMVVRRSHDDSSSSIGEEGIRDELLRVIGVLVMQTAQFDGAHQDTGLGRCRDTSARAAR